VALLAPDAALDAQVRMTVAPQEQPVVLRGATIHTVTNGVIQNGMIVLDRGKITAIGTNVESRVVRRWWT
jgi:imidazolonepropionase-like amidohydrolase